MIPVTCLSDFLPRKTLVLDLDETLVHAYVVKDHSTKSKSKILRKKSPGNFEQM